MGYNLLINGVYWGYNPLTNHLLSSWYIQVTWAIGDLNRLGTHRDVQFSGIIAVRGRESAGEKWAEIDGLTGE